VNLGANVMEGYIRGRRQLKALFYFFEAILRRNILSAKRELEIISGYAKPYSLIMECGVCGLRFLPKDWDGTIIEATGEFVCPMCAKGLMKVHVIITRTLMGYSDILFSGFVNTPKEKSLEEIENEIVEHNRKQGRYVKVVVTKCEP